MQLKPSLLQLTVIIMILSLVTSCTGNSNNQADCNNQSQTVATNSQAGKVANKQPNDCPPNSNSGSSSTGNRFRSSGSSSSFGSGDSGDSSRSSGKVRGGFGSFGRGGSGGG
ncbi:hypothetical protein [Calothrix sp. PCC 6303]|uniref:hypothetical protein n=1 Tax=Calothrix sp. PCC 6303 TaxID=1170562 RepID=UPI0002A019C2|nr:hypothetical protein [Calothrix sp. PCC 6303]AFZ03508.1 hypothetical protein Cal6303_4608 [Calothrix sp. PCC 6303]